MKKSVIPSGARDLTLRMSALTNHTRIDEAKTLQRYRKILIAYEGSLGPSRTGFACATRDDRVFI
jgi:hypothetical protein